MSSINEFIKQFKEVLSEIGGEAYLVGGFVRDRLINYKIEPKDLDIVYDGDIDKILMRLKDIGYNFFPLKESASIYRHDAKTFTLDISKMKGKTIEEDLSKRDFTINAICIKLIENKIIDPFKGRRSIECRIIQHVNENSIEEDPVRILRGIRLYIKYGMHFNLQTEEKVVEFAPQLKTCAKERVFNEFMNLIEIDTEGRAFEFLDDYNVLRNLFPYIDELKTIGKCKYHTKDVFTHMNLTYGVYKDVLKGKIAVKGFELTKLEDVIGNFSIKEYIGIACFLHDIGKFKCYKEEGNNVSFIDHENAGAEIGYNICESMRFPKKASELIKNIIEAHMYALGFFKDSIHEKRKEFYRFFERYNKYVPFILLVSFCDNYATNMLLDLDDEKEKYKEFIENMYMEYKCYYDICNNKLVDGNDIIEITAYKDENIKKILYKINELRYLQVINNRKDAINYLKTML